MSMGNDLGGWVAQKVRLLGIILKCVLSRLVGAAHLNVGKMNRDMRKVRIKNNCFGYSLFFIKPKHICDTHQLARELMQIKSVKEVLVTSGVYGFVVKCPSELEREREVHSYIKKRYGNSNISKLECHYQYVK